MSRGEARGRRPLPAVFFALGSLFIVAPLLPTPTVGGTAPPPEIARAARERQPFIAYAGFDPRIYYWRVLEDAARTEARRRGLFFVSLSSVDKSAETQKRALLRALDAGAEGLLIGITPPGVEQVFAEARRRGVPVVVVDQPSGSAFVDAEIYALAQSGTARAVAHFLQTPVRPASGRILVLTGDAGSSGARARAIGFKAPLEAVGFRVDVRYCAGWSAGKAVAHALDAFQDADDPPVAAFAAFETASVALGIVAPLSGPPIPLYGYDLSPAVHDLIEEGVLTAALNQGPARMGRAAVAQLDRLLQGEVVERTLEYVPDLVVASGVAP